MQFDEVDNRTSAEAEVRDQAVASAGLSLLIPGLAQLLQHRWIPAIIHLGAVGTYLLAVRQAEWGHAGWLALAWNLWSGLDAYWYERHHASRHTSDED
ncbi:MAG: hypothetical protein ACREOK_15010 [Gemmatimonadaceae bacterium]